MEAAVTHEADLTTPKNRKTPLPQKPQENKEAGTNNRDNTGFPDVCEQTQESQTTAKTTPAPRIILDMRYPIENLATLEAALLQHNKERKSPTICFGKSETRVKIGKMDHKSNRFSAITTPGTLISILKYNGQRWGYTNQPTYRISSGGARVLGYGGHGIPEEILTMILTATPDDMPNLPIIDLPPAPGLVVTRIQTLEYDISQGGRFKNAG